MNFCSHCGGAIKARIPEGDNRLRYVCDQCGLIHYQNPHIIAGCLAIHNEQVLLCRRAIEPRYGLWTLPAGFMENGETTQEAAARETQEEALAEVDIDALYTLTSIPQLNQVQLIYRASLSEPKFGSGEESLEVALFKEEEIPWDNLAFSTIRNALSFYFKDRQAGEFPLRHVTIQSPQLQRPRQAGDLPLRHDAPATQRPPRQWPQEQD
jgi:ADP-ribose pyrophosphatase YjhB (NUDIX family)